MEYDACQPAAAAVSREPCGPAGAKFEHMDYREAMGCLKRENVVYCDPPYTHTQAIVYGAQMLSLEDLLGRIGECKERGVSVALSIDRSKRPSDLPPTPRPYGTDSGPTITPSLSAFAGKALPNPAMNRAHDYAGGIQRPDGIEIRWPPTELPALEAIELEPIDVAILAPAGGGTSHLSGEPHPPSLLA